MTRLMLVEDDQALREQLAEQLKKSGFSVRAASSILEALAIPLTEIDLIILDWELSDGEGLDFLRSIRRKGANTPVLFLTARTELNDKILGLELGANDYMVKPFEFRELVTRIRVQTRKPESASAPKKLVTSGIELDFGARTVHFEGAPVTLAKMEFELLRFFMENPSQALGRDEILNQVWGLNSYPNSRTVDTHVAILRKKLKASLFETLQGVGYRFKAES